MTDDAPFTPMSTPVCRFAIVNCPSGDWSVYSKSAHKSTVVAFSPSTTAPTGQFACSAICCWGKQQLAQERTAWLRGHLSVAYQRECVSPRKVSLRSKVSQTHKRTLWCVCVPSGVLSQPEPCLIYETGAGSATQTEPQCLARLPFFSLSFFLSPSAASSPAGEQCHTTP